MERTFKESVERLVEYLEYDESKDYEASFGEVRKEDDVCSEHIYYDVLNCKNHLSKR